MKRFVFLTSASNTMTSTEIEADAKTPLMERHNQHKLSSEQRDAPDGDVTRINIETAEKREGGWSLSYVDFVPGQSESSKYKTFR